MLVTRPTSRSPWTTGMASIFCPIITRASSRTSVCASHVASGTGVMASPTITPGAGTRTPSSPGVLLVMTSRSESMPISAPARTTGRCRMSLLVMTRHALASESSGEITTTSRVMVLEARMSNVLAMCMPQRDARASRGSDPREREQAARRRNRCGHVSVTRAVDQSASITSSSSSKSIGFVTQRTSCGTSWLRS